MNNEEVRVWFAPVLTVMAMLVVPMSVDVAADPNVERCYERYHEST